MGTALILIGFLALLAAVVVLVTAVVRKFRRRPTRPLGRAAALLGVAALTLTTTGAVLSPLPAPDQAGPATARRSQTATPRATTPPSPAGTATPTESPTPAPARQSPTAVPPPAAVHTSPPQPATRPAVAAISPTRTTGPAATGTGPVAVALLALPVRGRAPRTGYSRNQFGPAWADVDGNGCDTRDDILRRDLADPFITAGTGGCQASAGTLPDPYSNTSVPFVRGQATSAAVQIDHVVALSNAWQTGAFAWTPELRERFANDPLNLLAVSGRLNEQKSDGDAATWLPPATRYRCAYVARQVAVKTTYRLWVTPPERAAAAGVLASCAGQPLPASTDAAVPTPDPAAASPATNTSTAPEPERTQRATPKPQPVDTSTPGPVNTAGLDPRFPSCMAAVGAGYGPYTEGVDPEYGWYRDADHDGIDCEHR